MSDFSSIIRLYERHFELSGNTQLVSSTVKEDSASYRYCNLAAKDVFKAQEVALPPQRPSWGGMVFNSYNGVLPSTSELPETWLLLGPRVPF